MHRKNNFIDNKIKEFSLKSSHGKNDFAEVPRNLNIDLKINFLDHENRTNIMSNVVKDLDILTRLKGILK